MRKRDFLFTEDLTSKKESLFSKDFYLSFLTKTDYSFSSLLLRNKLPYSAKLFIIISLICGLVVGGVYYFTFKRIGLGISMFLISIFIPYATMAANQIIDFYVNKNIDFQNFIELLQTELSITSSIEQIFSNIIKRGTSEEVVDVLSEAITHLRMGDSIPNVLERCENNIKNKHLKITFVILRINYELGSDETIKSLDTVKISFKDTISNIIEFKEKVSAHLSDKLIFLAFGIIMPVASTFSKPDFFDSLFALPFGEFIVAFIIGIIIGGCLIIDRIATKIVREA